MHKAGQLLSIFTLDRPAWGLQEMARALDWDVATTHRFAKALVDIRFLEYDEDGTYTIGLLPMELTSVFLSTAPRRRHLLETVEKISDECGLTVQVGVLEEDRVAIVASHESRQALRAAAMLGERLPIHASAVGKAILMQLDSEQARSLIPAKLTAFTANTITSRERLFADIDSSRSSGVTHADGEWSVGLYALAVPIPAGYFTQHPAGLTCVGISREIVPAQWATAERALRRQAAQFTSEMETTLASVGSPLIREPALGEL